VGTDKTMLKEIFADGNVIYIIFLGIAMIAFHLKKLWLRYMVMLAALATIGFLQMGCPSPVRAIEMVVENISQPSTVVTFIAKIAIVLLSAIFFGKIFCGWVCPKGSIQEFLYQRKLRINIPAKLDKVLRRLKYVTLVLIIVLPLLFHYKPFNPEISPFAALFNLGGGTIAIVLLATVLPVHVSCRRIAWSCGVSE
jgi:NosR/NirI family nitrous oxide reductase transcriptional regulator